MTAIPWHASLILLRPRRIWEHLHSLEEQGLLPVAPNLWQIELGILRMWHRVVFRADSVGTCADHPVRNNWRSKLLYFRPLRFPFLVKERAIAPLDHSGLAQPTDRMICHLLAAHHDKNQFAYDLEILRGTPGALEEVLRRTKAVLEEDTARSRWLKDLCIFERYHENLLVAVEAALSDGPVKMVDDVRDDADISFSAYMRWCAAQPTTPAETWRAWRAGAFPHPLTALTNTSHQGT